ncbi:MAG TPA: GWxTD domain-containing protein [Candidatus Aminicenantes bacterium]|nr:GWxTD domain-containing protein [Candidatus Aminicenantes bacterium]
MARNQIKNRNNIGVAFLLVLLIGLSACSHLQRMEKQLPPGDREFIQEVRYIITTEERKQYVNIPAEERAEFRRNFWRRRDLTPDTERNEYKETYYARVQEANRLFRSEGNEGWLTDRGRVFVLLGPPDHRQVYPMGYSFYEPPVEVWRYGFFPIIFVDRFHQGKYEMAAANAYYLNAVSQAQIMLNKPHEALEKDVRPNFGIDTKAEGVGTLRVNLEIPYALLLFTREGDEYKAVLEVQAALTSADESEVWSMNRAYAFSITEKQLDQVSRGYKLDFPAEAGAAGDYVLTVRVSNKGDDKVAEQSVNVRVR